MTKTALLYSSHDGHTQQIAQHISGILQQAGHAVQCYELGTGTPATLQDFDQIVLGANVRYGHHGKAVLNWIKQNQALLDSKPNAFFSVNLIARNPEKRSPATNAYVRKFLERIEWKPNLVAIFAGKLDYPRYKIWDRIMIQLIMKMTKGPTHPQTIIDYTDWEQVRAFGKLLAEHNSGDFAADKEYH